MEFVLHSRKQNRPDRYGSHGISGIEEILWALTQKK
jgi:hypothetical protein